MVLSWELVKLKHGRAPISDPNTKQPPNKRLCNTSVLTTYGKCECKPINILENNL